MAEPIEVWPGVFRRLGDRRIFVRRDVGGTGGATGGGTGSAAPGRDAYGGTALDHPLGRMVYVHGLAGASTDWTDLMGALSNGSTADAPDLPGFGQSPPPPDGDYGVDAHAAVVVGLIRSGEHPVHLVGNSLGATVAVRLAAERPDLVRTLTLISPALPDLLPRPVPLQMTGALVPVVGRWVYERIQSRPPEMRVQSLLDATFHDPAVWPAKRVLEALEAERERDRLDYAHTAVLESLRCLAAEYLRRGPRALWRQAAGVHRPTLLVYGTGDRFVRPRMALRAAATFPDNRLVLLPRTGHVPMKEQPERVAREMRPFLAAAAARADSG
ncbi:pimeloyl-ACP methyl ester carboxylesterase [Nocardiopsis mwathae]|uniref:Pimeloyl-ACP methyl ester carboxylesterase n=1 Tax=Nocardiopsis mwathae TaxID=1472723 RepID=A0A7W9YKM3_9ACTN|nr:alpha/beta hydrolase [Nocardiopsis mwathae]MBB6173266.1 pimeloyl-ACP methyl ester carboxylesterase [Nocardiopsis mwathae]